jgi:hypothetical protein
MRIAIWIIGGLIIYLIPSFLAFQDRKENKKAILALNICLGWTLIGWVVALVWSLTKEKA